MSERARVWRGAPLALLCVGLLATSMAPPRPLLVWNVSSSAPLGPYLVGSTPDIRRGDRVVARVPLGWRAFAAHRRYIPINVPLVKRAAGIAGDRICAKGGDIFLNGRRIAARRSRDGKGRPMPAWRGCFTLGRHALFLLNDTPDSFDGRYFGATPASDMIGRAVPLWIR